MKNANVYRKEGWECIEMYRNVSDKKTWSYTCITRKKWSYTCITRKMEWYMYNSKKNGVIHSYTFHRSRRFWGKGFWKSIVFFCFCLTKKCGPMGRDCWNQTVHISYNLGFKIWQVRHNGPQWFKSKGMHAPQTTLFWARQADWKVSTGLTSADVAKSWPGLLQPQRLIEPLLYKLGSGITVLQGCLAASSNSSLLRLMEPHTSQFKVLFKETWIMLAA